MAGGKPKESGSPFCWQDGTCGNPEKNPRGLTRLLAGLGGGGGGGGDGCGKWGASRNVSLAVP